jgi:hypothetical protein
MTLASEHTRKGTTMPPDDPLIGTWRLLSWENRSLADGGVSHPLGEDAVGYIMYGPDGYMSVAISRPDRARFAAGDLLGGARRRGRGPPRPTSPTAARTSSGGRRSSTSWS